MPENVRQLISYIAPATRRYAEGDEPFLRPEVGFTPNWYRDAISIDFGEKWHADPEYRRSTIIAAREELESKHSFWTSVQAGLPGVSWVDG